MATQIPALTPIDPFPTRALPQDRFDTTVKNNMDQLEQMIDELNTYFITSVNAISNQTAADATTCTQKASAAATSATNAANSATAAANSASTASTKASEASGSASTASTKASQASTSATNAANSATAAANSATAAAGSATSASGSASTATSKASAAATSATNAANSASAASTSATNAANSATSASGSATTATNKANAASTSATNAANSATAANQAKEAALAAQQAAEAADQHASTLVDITIATTSKAGLVKPDGSTISIDSSGLISAIAVPWNGVTSKPSSFTPSSHTHGNITNAGLLGTASRALMTDGDKKITVSSVTSTELGYLSGVTSAIQTQLNGKAASSHGTHVTFSTTAPAANGTASVGSATTVARSDHVHPLQTNVSGTAGNVTGTVAIANGGTGATTRLNALKALTNENVSTNAQHFLTITDSWGKGGYTSVADVKTVLGLGSAAYTNSNAYAAASHSHSYLPLAGGTLTGDLILNNKLLKPKVTGVTRGTSTTATYPFVLQILDNADKTLGGLYYEYLADKSAKTHLMCYQGTTNANTWQSIGVGYNSSGNVFTWAPTPATADNSTQIATTAFVKAQGYLTSHQSLGNYIPYYANVTEIGRYLDFHNDNGTHKYDYDARICTNSQGDAAGRGVLDIYANEVRFNAYSQNQIRLVCGNYGVIFRNDGSNFYLLKTASGSATGQWDSTRPLTVNLSNGVCSINGNAATVTGTAGTSTLSWNSEVTLYTVGGHAIKAKLPANPNTNTTYTFATGSTNGTFNVTPSGGSAQAVAIKGLGTAAYTASTAYAAASHTHSYLPLSGGTLTGTHYINSAQIRVSSDDKEIQLYGCTTGNYYPSLKIHGVNDSTTVNGTSKKGVIEILAGDSSADSRTYICGDGIETNKKVTIINENLSVDTFHAITIKNKAIDIPGTPTNNQYSQIRFLDSSDYMFGRVGSLLSNNGYNSTGLWSKTDISGTSTEKFLAITMYPTTQTSTSGSNTVSYTSAVRTNAAVIIPVSNKATSLGIPTLLWKNVYSGTSVIVISDKREKSDMGNIPDALLDVWGNIDFKLFKYYSSIEEKDSLARSHTGVYAQDIEDICNDANINPKDYGFFCYDEWQASPESVDENGNVIEEARSAGNRYGIRYEELLCVEAAYERREIARLKARLTAIENRLGIA